MIVENIQNHKGFHAIAKYSGAICLVLICSACAWWPTWYVYEGVENKGHLPVSELGLIRLECDNVYDNIELVRVRNNSIDCSFDGAIDSRYGSVVALLPGEHTLDFIASVGNEPLIEYGRYGPLNSFATKLTYFEPNEYKCSKTIKVEKGKKYIAMPYNGGVRIAEVP
jgi:hypothetical protein